MEQEKKGKEFQSGSKKSIKKYRNLLFLLPIILVGIFIYQFVFNTEKQSREVMKNYTSLNIDRLNQNQSEGLYKLCKVWGFVKYYHPNVTKNNIDMDEELLILIPEVLESKNQKEVDQILVQWIGDLGKIDIRSKEIKNTKKVKISSSLDWIGEEKFLDEELKESLIKIQKSKIDKTEKYVKLTPNVGNPIFINEKEYNDMDYSDKNYRLLGLFRYWNAIEYFFPYKYLIDENWDEVLKVYLPEFIQGDDMNSYNYVFNGLTRCIKDDHATLYKPGVGNLVIESLGDRFIPLHFNILDDKVVYVEGFLNNEVNDSNFKVGDVVLKINGEDIDDVITRLEELYPQQNKNHKNVVIRYLLNRTKEEKVEITFKRDEEINTEDIVSIHKNKMNYDNEDKKSHEMIGNNIGYINPGNLKKNEINKIMEKFLNTKGIIVDLRNYPSDFIVFSLGKYLMPEPTEFAAFTIPSLEIPGQFAFTSSIKVGAKNPDYYKGKVMILVNKYSQSQPEYTAMALRVAPNAVVLGTPSNGADGNVSKLTLPGGFITSFTGIGVYYPDGGETQRVGIIPDVIVKPTIEGIREGRDELVEKAIEVIENK
ncbi:S41 family peptidase [Oceanirhabdus sp. W0125-5]|uniref:S41 family peptidase n=1 Tax=Oceanirhabdus sp. W0125-5 TaxID=2999116 RepID=UPI0022F324A0|nr:S41 family peptidase [Oceanirhabdus sp. W0125-5]WBW95186.1 S41 family peptidase [Oceanirhabdus sp. W0125-5]